MKVIAAEAQKENKIKSDSIWIYSSPPILKNPFLCIMKIRVRQSTCHKILPLIVLAFKVIAVVPTMVLTPRSNPI